MELVKDHKPTLLPWSSQSDGDQCGGENEWFVCVCTHTRVHACMHEYH